MRLSCRKTISCEEVGGIAGERIGDNEVSPWVGRELYGLHTITLRFRDRFISYIMANTNVATQAMRFFDRKP